MDAKIVSGAPAPGSTGIPGTPAVVDGTFSALRTSIRPLDYQVPGGPPLGHYSVAAKSGLTTGLSAGGLLFAFRWNATNALAVIERISVGAIVTTAFTTAQAVDVDGILVRGWTASDSAGTALTPTANSNKMRTNMGTSLAGDIRIAPAAGLTAGGTKTPDANAFCIGCIPNTNAIGTGLQTIPIYDVTAFGQHPVILAANEGFNLRVVTAQGAVGVVAYYIKCDWAEVAGY